MKERIDPIRDCGCEFRFFLIIYHQLNYMKIESRDSSLIVIVVNGRG